MTQNSEKQLVSRLKSGERRAYEEFLDTHQDRVYNLVRRMVGEPDAEDVAQEALIEICKSVKSFNGGSSLFTWVYRVAVNICLEHRRKRKVLFVPFEDDEFSNPIDPHDEPEVTALRNEIKGDVEAALDKLPEIHRDVVVLHELHGLTYQECAQALGCPVGTVKSRLSNAFTKLREILRSYASEGEVAI